MGEWVNAEASKNKVFVKQGYTSSKLLDRINWDVYAGRPWTAKTVLVVGAGPIGLRMAIEARLMGARVVIAEQRDKFARANVMKMWAIARSDLDSLSITEIPFLKGKDSPKANIALMQHALLRLAMVLGAELLPDLAYKGLVADAENPGRWKATF